MEEHTRADLKAALDELGLSPDLAAPLLDVSPSTLRGWCSRDIYALAPRRVWDRIEELRDLQEDEAMRLASEAAEGLDLMYFRNQGQSDARWGDGLPYRFHNMSAAKAARDLRRKGVGYRFDYPD